MQHDLEPIYIHHGLLAQAAVDLVALGVGVDIVGPDNPRLDQTRDHRVIVGDFFQARGLAVEIGTAITHIGDIRNCAHNQGNGDRRAHIGSLLHVALVHRLVGMLYPLHQDLHEHLVIQWIIP